MVLCLPSVGAVDVVVNVVVEYDDAQVIIFATTHTEVIFTMCHGVRLALLIPKLLW